jgi:hypothetical protein
MQALHSVDPITNVPEPAIAPCKVALGAGFGWLIRDYHGRKLVSHAGSTGAIIALVPEEKLGVVVLTNLAAGVHSMVMYDLLDRMLGIPRAWTNREFIEAVLDEYEKPRDAEYARLDRERRADMRPHGPLIQYTGTYASDLVGLSPIPLLLQSKRGYDRRRNNRGEGPPCRSWTTPTPRPCWPTRS